MRFESIRKKVKRALVFILSIMMLLGILPIGALAEYNPDGTTDNESLQGEATLTQSGFSTMSNGGVEEVASGNQHSVAIMADGSLWAWGRNNNGQLGDGTTTDRLTPTQIQPGTTWQSITAGWDHTAGIKIDGSLWTWGRNSNGGLGDGTTVDKHIPTQIQPGTTWQSITAGGNFTVGIKADGTLWTWGQNQVGQLGNGTMVDNHIPTQIQPGTTWQNITTGSAHTIGIRADGSLWTWGWNLDGILGIGSTIYRIPIPTQIQPGTTWQSITAAPNQSFGIRADGSLWAWGWGPLGDGTTINSLTPIPIQPGTTWQSITVGWGYTLGMKTDNSLWAWGSNDRGQLGDGTTTRRLIPTQIQIGTTWQSITTSYGARTFGIKTDGSLWAWGSNLNGWLGDGTTTDRHTPVLIFPGASEQQWRSPLATNRFVDVPNNNWQNTPVSWADRNRITTGSPAGSNTFKPDDSITRAEFVTFLHRVYGLPSTTRATFSDMPDSAAFQNSISWASTNGVTTGTGNNTFSPNANITREQIAAMLYRYVGGGVPAPVDRLGSYTDQSRISTWVGARDAVNWAVYHGIMGRGTTTLNPGGNATRAEAVAMLHRVVETFNIPAP